MRTLTLCSASAQNPAQLRSTVLKVVAKAFGFTLYDTINLLYNYSIVYQEDLDAFLPKIAEIHRHCCSHFRNEG